MHGDQPCLRLDRCTPLRLHLFTAGAAPKKEKQEKLEAAMDRLRGKFGTDVISYGAARPEKEEDPLP